MAISDQLTLLANTKESIRTSINNKGGSVGANDTFASYATAIDNLPSGGDDSTLRDLIEGDITTITIPSGTTGIKAGAFQNCTSLTSVSIPNTVTSISDRAFFSCSALQSINIPSNVTRLGTQCFAYCVGLTSITIPDSVTTIPSYLVDHCNNLTEIIVGNNVSTIQSSAFSTSTDNFVLRAIVINSTTVPNLQSKDAFNYTRECPIYVPAESVEAYKTATNWSDYSSRIFAIEDAILFTPTNGDPAISVKNYDLATANYVQSSDVPSTIKNGAGSLEIGEGVTRIGMAAFQNCTSLTSITLPSTLTRIDEVAFNGCSALTSVTVNADTPPALYGAAFDSTNNCPIYVPRMSVDTYKAANNWSTYAGRIQPIPVHVATLTLSDTSTVDLIDTTGNGHIVSSMTSQYASTTVGALIKADTLLVKTQAFSGFTNLASVTFETGSRCNTLAVRAFQNCSSLTSVTIPSGVTTIGTNVFEGCSSLETVTFETGSQLLMINGNVFKNCTSLTDITLPDSVTVIDNSAFSGCTSLETVAIGEGIEEMGVSVFSGCDNLTDITILADAAPDGSGEDPFSGCDASITLHVPAESVSAYEAWLNDDLGTDADITVAAISE